MQKQNVRPKVMSKRITVSMLEAHFNALPNLLRYIIKRAEFDLEARMALTNFKIDAWKEQKRLDPIEAVFGFGIMLTTLNPSIKIGHDQEAQIIIDLIEKFSKANNLGSVDEKFMDKVNIPNINEK